MAASLPSQSSSVNKTNKEEMEESMKKAKKSFQIYRERISKLPKGKDWTGEDMSLYEGYWYPSMPIMEGVMCAQDHFQARPDDIILISHPKSGTTWLKALIFAIMKRTCYGNSTHPLLTNNPHACVPFLELLLFQESPLADVDNMPSPRLLATHIPYTSLPKSILLSGCKIVYVCRDPKDVLISLWYFSSKSDIALSKELQPFPLEEAFELFTKGIYPSGPFWDHVQGYWKASQEYPDKLFFVTYEEMMRDTLMKVKRLAEYLGQPFSMEEEKELVAEEIIKFCSLDLLKNLEVNKCGHSPELLFRNDAFFRKGEVGDWRNHLTTQMAESLDQITDEKLNGLFQRLNE